MLDKMKMEKEVLQFWEKEGIYELVQKKVAGGQDFYFCDGPPYATGEIHPGTAWNKCMKDAVCRYKRTKGFNVRVVPGFDTHGLPIEVKVEQELKLKRKKDIEKIGVPLFIDKCKRFATQHIEVMSRQFKRVGVWMDFDNPYVTYKPEYIESCWKTLKKAHEMNLLTEGAYVLPYCSRCETTLANYELEYGEKDDPSIYVKFKLSDSDEYLVIWTTTPWTLVANIAVMVHPTFTYVKAKVNGETWIVAKERLDAVMALSPGKSAVVTGEMSGKKLEGLEYIHPLQAKLGKNIKRKVVLSDEFVTLEDGSGLVHCAPGHGPQDFIIGKRFDLEIFSPVDGTGRFTEEAGDYKGMELSEANKKVIDDLKKEGMLIHAGTVRHRYPHCWRCSTSLIFLTTSQWFIKITDLREKMLNEIERTGWHPPFAKTRFKEFVTTAPDWCISRQRYWGTPLPIWRCEKCKKIKVVGSKDELPPLKDLHKPYIDEVTFKCECGGEMKRVSDIVDVWFDSGNAIWASLPEKEKERYQQADLILEGKDQTRGWFYSLLGCGVIYRNEIPYKNLLMHGFFVDEKGEKMSKSLGNFVPLEEVVDKYGADSFRLWSLGNTVWDDLKFNWEEIKEAHKTIDILHNISIFLERFSPEKSKESEELEREDKWLISRLNNLVLSCTESFDNYEPHKVVKEIEHFVVEDMSRFYIKLVKRRMKIGRSVPAALSTLSHALFTVLKLITPITPFIAERIYSDIYKKHEKEKSISLFKWPEADRGAIDSILEKQVSIAQEISTAIINARQKGDVKLRWPLEEAVVLTSSTEATQATEILSGIIEVMTNVKKLKIVTTFPSKKKLSIHKGKMGARFKEETNKVIELLEKMPVEQVEGELSKTGKFVLERKYLIDGEVVTIDEKAEGHEIASFSEGKVYLNTKVSKELYEEAMVREVGRRVQMMRKEMGLVEEDKVTVNISTENELKEMLEKNKEQLAQDVNAKEVTFLKEKGKKWDIEEFELEVSIKK